LLLLSRLGVAFHRRAGADQVAVAIDVVDAVDRRPAFVDAEGVGQEAGSETAVPEWYDSLSDWLSCPLSEYR
jgi:hypothetical protein